MEFLSLLRIHWDRAVGIGAALAGAACLLLGFVGVSNEAYVAGQLPYFISGGLFGLFLLGIAAASWLSADLRDEWRELRALRTLLELDQRRIVTDAVLPGHDFVIRSGTNGAGPAPQAKPRTRAGSTARKAASS